MSEVHSHEGEMAGAESAISKLAAMGAGEVSDAKSSALKFLTAGKDIQLLANPGKDRTAVYAAWASELAGPVLVVCSTAEEAEAIKGFMTEHKIKADVAASADDLKAMLANGSIVIAQSSVAASAFKGSSKPQVKWCVVDAVDSIVSAASLSELESLLLSFRDTNPESQLVLIAAEPSLNMSALSRRFLAEPKVCSILGSSVESLEHVYYEVGTSLLAKPQALCDLIELEGGASCIVFCNSPSDADFADVILKKRGITSLKLIGYVPQIKLSKAIVSVQKKEVSTLVLTDVAARGVPLEDFDVVVNYSIPTDPEVYFHRVGSGPESKTKKVISLVAAMDISNFHYLKKLGKLEFKQGELPTPEQLFVGKFAQLRSQAVEKGVLNDPTISTLVDKVLADASAKEIVGLLLHNTITVLPSLKSASSAAQEESSDEYESEDEGEDFGNRRGGRRGGRDRDGGRDGGRDRDGGRRGGRDGNRRQHTRGGSEEFEDERGQLDEEESQQPRRGRRGGHDGERSGEGRREREPRPPRKQMVVDKEARLYVGAGSKQGVSQETLTSALVSACGLEAGEVHRVSIRPLYSFVDVPEAVASKVLEKLPEVTVGGSGDAYFVKKAVTLSIPREGAASEGEDAPHNGESHHSDDVGHSDSQGADSDEGPTLLAVDEM